MHSNGKGKEKEFEKEWLEISETKRKQQNHHENAITEWVMCATLRGKQTENQTKQNKNIAM